MNSPATGASARDKSPGFGLRNNLNKVHSANQSHMTLATSTGAGQRMTTDNNDYAVQDT